MNNEPVAWMLADKKAEHIRSIMAVQHDFVPQGCVEIPLYTHPVSKAKDRFPNYESICLQCGTTIYKPFKELTDEEIYACFHQYFVLGEPKPTHYELEYEDLIEFARAILRKAQEK